MLMLIMLCFYIGLFICLILYLKKRNIKKTMLFSKQKQATTSNKRSKNRSNVKRKQ